MKAETLRDLISRKHPPTIRWLSNPGLLKHSTQSIEKCVPCAQRGAPRTGWAGETQPPLTREVRAAVFTQAYAELCRQPAACLLAAEMENYLSVPTAEQGWESSCLSSQEHFHLLPAALPNSTQGKQKFRHSCPGACVTDPHAHRLFVFTGSENSSPSPSRVSPAQRWGSGWEFGTRPRHAAAPAAPRTGDAVPAAEAEWGPPGPGERAEPKVRGWMCVILPRTFVAKALGGRVREPLVCSLVTPG